MTVDILLVTFELFLPVLVDPITCGSDIFLGWFLTFIYDDEISSNCHKNHVKYVLKNKEFPTKNKKKLPICLADKNTFLREKNGWNCFL